MLKPHPIQLTQLIADKEKKSSSYREGRLDTLSEEKVTKIKKFAKEYIAKVIRKMDKSGIRPKPSAPDTPSTSMHTPNSHDGGDALMHDISMSVEEAMGMEVDSDSDHDADADADNDAEAATEGLSGLLPTREDPEDQTWSRGIANNTMNVDVSVIIYILHHASWS